MSICLLIFTLFILCGCALFERSDKSGKNEKPTNPNIVQEKKDIDNSAEIVGGIAVDVGNRADTIDKHTDKIKNKSDENTKDKIKPELEGIKSETDGLKEDKYKLIAVEQKLKEVTIKLEEQQKLIEKYTAYTKDSEKTIANLEEKIKKLQDSNAKLLQTMMSWIAVACVVGIGASIAIGVFFKTPTAFFIAAGCIVTLGASVAVSLYMQYIAWIAILVLGIGCVGVIIYVAMQVRNKDIAVNELVHTGEVVKTYLDTKTRQKIFGTKVEPGVAHSIQSAPTKNLVKRVRNAAKNNRIFGLAPEI
jgi:hypothetical protein